MICTSAYLHAKFTSTRECPVGHYLWVQFWWLQNYSSKTWLPSKDCMTCWHNYIRFLLITWMYVCVPVFREWFFPVRKVENVYGNHISLLSKLLSESYFQFCKVLYLVKYLWKYIYKNFFIFMTEIRSSRADVYFRKTFNIWSILE